MNLSQSTKIGSMVKPWKDGYAQSITFTVTEECNLRCGYCYMLHKNSSTVMSWDIAKRAVDFFLSNPQLFPRHSVLLDFIGGEPFLEIDLIDRITDYFKIEAYKRNHPWFTSYRISISTNGLLYDSPAVQDFIRKNHNHLSIGISVDGNKLKHDMQRVKPNGEGSFDDIMKVVPLWLKQFPVAATKSTYSHDDLPYLKDSVISLWKLGIRNVMANVVFEDVWHEGDDEIFERQLKELGDYILENEIWKEDYSVRFLSPDIGFPLSERESMRNFCGSGNMIAVDAKGDLFPCIRFQSLSLTKKSERAIGNIFSGINHDKLRPFLALNMVNQSPEECRKCQIASGCALCVGNNYQETETGTIYSRATFICKMHKANVRACEYFWDKFERVTGLPSERRIRRSAADIVNDKTLFLLTSDDAAPYCAYQNNHQEVRKMEDGLLKRGLEYAEKNGFTPVILENETETQQNVKETILHIASANSTQKSGFVPVYDNCAFQEKKEGMGNVCILLLDNSTIESLKNIVTELAVHYNRINLILQNIPFWSDNDIDNYAAELRGLFPLVIDRFGSQDQLEINVLTDIFELGSMNNCNAGVTSITLAPNGKLYPCPAFYFDEDFKPIGDLENGITNREPFLFEFNRAGVCHECTAYHCKRCVYLNVKITNEITTPSKIQCLISHHELQAAKELQEQLFERGLISGKNINFKHFDPLESILEKQGGTVVCL